MKLTVALSFLLLALNAEANSQLQIGFESNAAKSSGELFVNTYFKRLQPKLQVRGYGAFADQNMGFELGDARHGEFIPENYHLFSKDGDLSGNIIRLDMARFPELHVRHFYLADGWELRPFGNVPLAIFSHGPVIIDGVINCDGGAGTSPANPIVSGLGGEAFCGGHKGGDGGSVGQSGHNGQTIVGGPGAGAAGTYTSGTHGAGGGGGGGFSTISNSAAGVYPGGGVASAGSGGANLNDPEILLLTGGAGAGGGSGSLSHAGGGGGAGGGVILIYAGGDVELGANGFISARGGAGGSTAGLQSGAGGSGGGGTILVFSAGNLVSNNVNVNPAEIDAQRDIAGVGGSGGHGGLGALGRTWVSTLELFAGVDITPDVEAPFSPGDIRYQIGVHSFTGQIFDLMSTLADINELQILPSADFIDIELRGSKQHSFDPVTSWAGVTSLASVSSHRYIQYKITLDNQDGEDPNVVENINVFYTKNNQNSFEFKAAGCGSVGQNSGSNSGQSPVGIMIFLVLLMMPLVVYFSIPKNKPLPH